MINMYKDRSTPKYDTKQLRTTAFLSIDCVQNNQPLITVVEIGRLADTLERRQKESLTGIYDM